ncbi:MAG: hypothetical protein ACXWKN_18150 [Phenylobacterium sp.]
MTSLSSLDDGAPQAHPAARAKTRLPIGLGLVIAGSVSGLLWLTILTAVQAALR